MKHPSIYLVAVLLGLASAGLIAWHVRAWQRLADEELSEREWKFHRRQFRRRVQNSALIGLLGAAILVGQLILDAVHSWRFQVAYWIGVVVLVLWIALLAIADMAATSIYFSRERTDFVVQHAKLQAELRKAREEESQAKNLQQNGKPGAGH
jgi:hypothetical protein